MKRLVFAATMLLALTVLFPVTVALAQVDPAEVLRQFFDARSRGDPAAALALFADDAVYDGVGLCTPNPCAGKAAIKPEIERLIAGSQPTVLSIQASGQLVTVRYEVRGARPRAAGVERIINIVTAEVRGDKIARFHVANDLTDPQTAQFLAFYRAQAAGQLPKSGEPTLPAPSIALGGVGVIIVGIILRRRLGQARC